MSTSRARVLGVDNFDSFVYNLVQCLGELGAEPLVYRHDELTLDHPVALDPDAVLISPGPGRPEDAGLSNDAIRRFAGERPVLGVCLGRSGRPWRGCRCRSRRLAACRKGILGGAPG